MGYRRASGDMGIRNYVAIIAAMDNSNPVVRRVASSVAGAVAIAPSFGRAMLGEDQKQHTDTLIGLGSNPNVYGAVVVSLETKSAHEVAEGIARTGRPVEAFAIEEQGGTVKVSQMAISFALRLAADAWRLQREPMEWSRFVLAVECGGSDGSSGLSSNPATGLVADMVVDRGGAVILSETFEMLGAEHLLAARARDEITARKILDIVNFCVTYSAQMGIDALAANPAPDNIAGGLSTIEEKALGAIKKGGSRTVQEVVGYGQRPTRKGLVIMDAPCPGVENMTALAAGGSHAIIFSTGRGNPSGNPVCPTIKVSGNPYTVASLADNIDVDVSAVITRRMPLDEAARLLDAELLAVCAGKLTRAEILGEVDVAISRIARCL